MEMTSRWRRAFPILMVAALACGSSAAPSTKSVGGGGSAWLLEDFSTYSSTANFVSDPRGIYSTTEDESTNQMTLDKSVGVNVDGYSLGQSIRYDYPAPACTSQTVERNLVLPSTVKEMWFELYLKFTANFTTQNSGGCGTPPDFKMFFLRIDESIGRGAVRWGSQTPPQITVEIGNAVDIYTGADISAYADNQWHKVRGHWLLNGANSVIQLSVDGSTIYQNAHLNAGGTNPHFYGVSLGRNLDQGIPSGTMSEWWGRVALFNGDPGWTF